MRSIEEFRTKFDKLSGAIPTCENQLRDFNDKLSGISHMLEIISNRVPSVKATPGFRLFEHQSEGMAEIHTLTLSGTQKLKDKLNKLVVSIEDAGPLLSVIETNIEKLQKAISSDSSELDVLQKNCENLLKLLEIDLTDQIVDGDYQRPTNN